MPRALSNEILAAIESLAARANGDVGALVAQARALDPSIARDDSALASAFEQAGARRAAAHDRTNAWWMACASALLRAGRIGSPQDEAERTMARFFGELSHSPSARGPFVESMRWIVGGQSSAAPTASTIELARRNATTHVERLDAELAQRAPLFQASVRAGEVGRAAEGVASYDAAAVDVRVAFVHALDHVLAQTQDPSLMQAATAALTVLDDLVLPTLRARVGELRRSLATVAPMHSPGMPIDPKKSFAGAAPPSFAVGASNSLPPHVDHAPPPSVPPPSSSRARLGPSLALLDAQMQSTYAQAWAQPGTATRAAFEQAVRARYARETEAIADAHERARALEHYVAHAMAQVPRA